jgi:hypothetical protein
LRKRDLELGQRKTITGGGMPLIPFMLDILDSVSEPTVFEGADFVEVECNYESQG